MKPPASVLLLGWLLFLVGSGARGQEKPKPEIKGSSLLVIHVGQKAKFVLYGNNLAPKEATAKSPLLVRLIGVSPSEGDAKKRGDQSVSVEVAAPQNCPVDTYEITLVQPDGTKLSAQIAVLSDASVQIDPAKTGATFAQATHLSGSSVAVTGSLEKSEFAVFAFDAKAGAIWEIQLLAGRVGSDLDAIVRLRDSAHLPLALSAGNPKKDRKILFHAPADGTYYLEIADANGRTGPALTYHLFLIRSN